MSRFSKNRRNFAAWVALLATGLVVAPAFGTNESQSQVRILVVGDSLSAEYGIARDSGWVALMRRRVSSESPGVELINSSISGDTTSGGLSRLPGLLERIKPDIVVIELGANDGLRGLPVSMTRSNLVKMIEMVKARNAQVVLVGIQVPPNYGREYAEAFRSMFGELAKEQSTALVPFLFEGLKDSLDYFQADRMHPNEAAQPVLMENVLATVGPLIKAAQRPAPRK